jgi:hypothetical protein
VTGEWIKLHNEDLNDLYSSANTLWVIKWMGHVAHMGKRSGLYRVLVGKPEGKSHFEDPGIDGRILRWIFRKMDVGLWTGLS